MCWFVTIGVHAAGAVALEERARVRAGFAVRRAQNPMVVRLFPPEDVIYDVTHGWCSCDLYRRPRASDEVEEMRLHARYRRKGWSEAKIERALRSSEIARSAHAARSREGGPERAFCEALIEQVRECGSVRLFAHMFSGNQLEEPVTCSGRRRIELQELLAAGFRPDELVEVVEESGKKTLEHPP